MKKIVRKNIISASNYCVNIESCRNEFIHRYTKQHKPYLGKHGLDEASSHSD